MMQSLKASSAAALLEESSKKETHLPQLIAPLNVPLQETSALLQPHVHGLTLSSPLVDSIRHMLTLDEMSDL